MEDAFVVHGGRRLSGEVQLEGAKNVALKVLISAVLFDKPITFYNIPNIKDIREVCELLKTLGVKVEVNGNTVTVDAGSLNTSEVNLLHASKTRVAFMLFAPFLYRLGNARIPNPGGCRIGARPIDRIVSLLKAFGVSVEYDSATGYYTAHRVHATLQAADFRFEKKTHTGTELAIMCAVCAEGESHIHNVALEPEIDDLITFLQGTGATIARDGESIHVKGVATLQTPPAYTIPCDRNNAVTYAVFALATMGDVIVKGADSRRLTTFLLYLDHIGAGYEIVDDGIRFYYKNRLKSINVTTSPEPGFMTDWQGPCAVLMTQAVGESIVHETVFENRFGYVDELNKLGAQIAFYEPHVENPEKVYQFDVRDTALSGAPPKQAIRIKGETPLHGGVMHVTDMRAGATLLIAACVATGESVVIGASEIDRGYETIEERLMTLGASIRRV